MKETDRRRTFNPNMGERITRPSFPTQTPGDCSGELTKEYNDGVIDPEFLRWELETLKRVYEGIPFVTIAGREFPVYAVKGDPKIEFPFGDLTKEESLCSKQRPIFPYESADLSSEVRQMIDEFERIVGPTIHYPKLLGFTSNGFDFNDKDEIKGLRTIPRPYRDTVYTTHILQYELWCAYKRLGTDQYATLEDLPIRKAIHGNNSDMKDIILSGCNRSALHDVTMAVMAPVRDDATYTYNYKIAMACRDNQHVAIYPGYWSFIPAGGFELFEDVGNRTPQDPVVTENYHVMKALNREYLEELFGDDEQYGRPANYNGLDLLSYDPRIMYLEDGYRNGSVKFEFLGVGFDLILLRQTLAFALRIDDANFHAEYINAMRRESQRIENRFNENGGLGFRQFATCAELICDSDTPVLPGTAAAYSLLMGSKLYTDIVNNDYKLIKQSSK